MQIQRVYGMPPRAVYAAIASGELFVALGAQRHSVRVDFRAGGVFESSAISGVIERVTADSVELVLADGTHVALTVDPDSRLTVDIPGAGDPARWAAGLAALAPQAGRSSADADERQSYDEWLDYYRTIIPGKLAGLSEADARRSFVGSATTLLGLAKHLTGVERNWFQVILDRRHRDEVGPNNRGGADSWRLEPEDTIASVLAAYDSTCAISRRTAVRHELTDVVADPHGHEISLRSIYVHMIEEIARHAGHADILRELVDGTTGLDPGVHDGRSAS